MITREEYLLLNNLSKGIKKSRQDVINSIHDLPFIMEPLRDWDAILDNLEQRGYVRDFCLTEKAFVELEPCRVKNAIILAAGGMDVSSKTVYSLPKGLYKVNGVPIIERQIQQLQAAGIKDICIVLGYKKELYFYLEDKYGVKLAINPYPKKNNIYSLFAVAELLDNTYICSCDNYFEQSPFNLYEYYSYHATTLKTDVSQELSVLRNMEGRITKVFVQKGPGECLYGHAYFNSCFSEKIRNFIIHEIENFRIDTLFWEEFYAHHILDLDMYALQYRDNFIREFDDIQEIQDLDGLFIENVSTRITEIICDVLQCQKKDIRGIQISSKGLTNLLFTFEALGEKYIFRYPGCSSTKIIYRKNEVFAQKIALAHNIDTTCIYIDEEGHKLAKFVDGIKDLSQLYYKNIEFMQRLAHGIRCMHDAAHEFPNIKEFYLNPLKEADRLFSQASETKGNLFELFKDLHSQIETLYQYTERDKIPKTMCHNDINADNCLLTDDTFDIIDWEFAGYNDPAYDFGRVIAEYDFEGSEIDEILNAYFGRSPTKIERLHWIAYVGIHNWYYVGWALYKESINEDTREWMLFFYKIVKKVLAYALPRYRQLYNEEII